MPLFGEVPLLSMGSSDDYSGYIARFNYRYYCVSCIRNIESVSKMQKCIHCSSINLILLKEKDVKEGVPLSKKISAFLESFNAKAPKRRSKEELPTN